MCGSTRIECKVFQGTECPLVGCGHGDLSRSEPHPCVEALLDVCLLQVLCVLALLEVVVEVFHQWSQFELAPL